MSFDIAILFFVFGFIIKFAKIDFEFPQGLSKSLMLLLLIAIGLKGGLALKSYLSIQIVYQAAVVLSLGLVLPLIAYPLLRYFGGFATTDAASMAAHYGSVSVGTFAVAIAYLETRSIAYESYFVLFLVLLEVPAILIGLMLAKGKANQLNKAQLKEIMLNPGVVLLIGAFLVGVLADSSLDKAMPLFKDLFGGILVLFLMEMGMVAAKQMQLANRNRAFLLAFSVFMPLLSGVIGACMGHYLLGFSAGGVLLLATLAASASYIAVPAAMRVALPEANHGLSIVASLGITFPFNVLVGIPAYWLIATQLTQ